MIEVAERADATLADVQQSAEAYAAFQRRADCPTSRRSTCG